jgi:hypothetical protein
MNKILKHTFSIAVFTSFFFGSSYFCKKATHNFSVNSITYSLKKGTEDLPADLQSVYNQKFRYLGKGAQAFAFVSEDNKYVIKFLRFDHLLAKPFIRLFSSVPYPYIQTRLQRSDREIKELLSSFEYARKDLNAFTGLYHIQLKALPKPITIIDRLGICHKIKNAPFLIQEFAPSLESQINSISLEDSKEIVNQLFEYFSLRVNLGIFDKDPNLLTNFGFKNHKLIEFDIGRFYPYNREISKIDVTSEMKKALSYIEPSLITKYPELKSYITSKLDNFLDSKLEQGN